MTTKADKAEALENMRESLKACGPKGRATLEIRWVGGGGTSTGRSDYYELTVWRLTQSNGEGGERKRPVPSEWLTRNACRALGCRFNEKREALLMTGCGYSKPLDIAQSLARLAGHPLHVVAPGQFAFTSGMVKP